jgi:beta-lactamase regulating signal transducer with metallopeptidase domain
MNSTLLVEAAIRSALLAVTVGVGLRVLSVRNVLAQKVAWGLVLGSAMALPFVLPMTEHWSVLPANVRVVIPADPENLLEELQARIQAKTTPEPKPAQTATPEAQNPSAPDLSEASKLPPVDASLTVAPQARLHAESETEVAAQRSGSDGYTAALPVSQANLAVAEEPQSVPVPLWRRISLLQLAGLVYLAVAGVMCARLLYGLLAALSVLRTARPVHLDAIELQSSTLTDGLRLRVSDSVSSPVTIGSAVILPNDYSGWDPGKLRIVLAHERSHIRQGDFYLQLLAGVYAAVVWFSPLGWWLKRKLSDLAEAISDRAGLEEAADRASYAQVLLEFAAAPRPTLIGVAMARHGSLSRRIERLLNDASFRQAFAGTRRALVAVIVVPVALFAATALVRVEAAGQQAPAPPPVPAAPSAIPEAAPIPPAPEEGVSTPEQIGKPPAPAVAPEAPESGAMPKTPGHIPEGVVAPRAPAHAPVPPAHVPAMPGVAPVAPVHVPAVIVLDAQPNVSLRAPIVVVPRVTYAPLHATMAVVAPAHAGLGYGYGVGQSASSESGTVVASNNGKHSGYRYWSSNGDSYAIVRGNGKENLTFSGDWSEGRKEAIAKARTQAAGKDFLWFTRDGKSYIVDDPTTIAQIEAMYKPMEELGRQQEELGKKQEVLGKQQEELGKQQEAASVPTPDMSKEIAKIDEAMAKLKASQGKMMTQDQFADLQEKIGELQGRLGEIQGQIGEKQGEFGERMGELGSKMGELGAQMGELGAQQGKIAQQADQKVRSIIDESLKNGKAKQVQ